MLKVPGLDEIVEVMVIGISMDFDIKGEKRGPRVEYIEYGNPRYIYFSPGFYFKIGGYILSAPSTIHLNYCFRYGASFS